MNVDLATSPGPGDAVPPPPRRDALSSRRTRFVTATAVVGMLSLAVSAGLWMWYERQLNDTLGGAIAEAQANTARAAREIDERLAAVPPAVQQIAQELGAGALQPAGVSARLHALVASGPAAGYGVAFDTFAAGASQRLYAPYVERYDRGPASETDLAELYPYTEYRFRWFSDTLLDGAGWMEATLFPETEDVLVLYSVPFLMPGREGYAGVAYAAVRLETIDLSLQNIDVGESGYGFVISREGKYLIHPRTELVRRGATLFETAWADGNTGLHKVAVRAIQGETLFSESPDEVTGRDNWIFAEPLKSTGWSVFAVFFRDEFRPDTNEERRQLIGITLYGLVGLWMFVVAISAASIADYARFAWACSNSLALVLVSLMVLCWYVADLYPRARLLAQNAIFDQGSAHEFLNRQGIDDRMEGIDDVAVIPTGVFIRSLAFTSGSEVQVSGYVWQRYDRIRHGQIPRGFSLPETFDPGQSQIQEIFRIETGQEERVGWYFAAKFRQVFDTGRFPFDRQDVWVRLAPPGVARNIVFVPDFEAYTIMNPSLRPGVSDTLVLTGWDLLSSYFDYRVHQFNASLGVPGYEDQERVPDLYFNVEMRRRFVGPFVSYMVPLAVTAGMLFALLLISSRREAAQGLLGFSAVEIVLGAAALFFVASFQHISMRETLDAGGLIYFEYFYFILYVLLMVVTINAILFASDIDSPVIEYADNLVPKVLFWPASLLVLSIVTLVQFY